MESTQQESAMGMNDGLPWWVAATLLVFLILLPGLAFSQVCTAPGQPPQQSWLDGLANPPANPVETGPNDGADGGEEQQWATKP